MAGGSPIEAVNLAIRKPDIDAFGEIRPGNYVMVSDGRQRPRHRPRDAGPGFRPVLHHQAAGAWHRARSVDSLWLRRPSRAGMCGSPANSGHGTTVRLYLPSPPPKGIDEIGGIGLRRADRRRVCRAAWDAGTGRPDPGAAFRSRSGSADRPNCASAACKAVIFAESDFLLARDFAVW